MIVDSHCHLHYLCNFQNNIENYLARAQKNGIQFLLNVATQGKDSKIFVKNNFTSYKENITLYDIYQWEDIKIAYSVGYHPTENYSVDYEELLRISSNQHPMEGKALAIGETGFDSGLQAPEIKLQEENFHKHLQVAKILKVPLIIHCRELWEIFLKNTIHHMQLPYIIHCFTGDIEVARKLLDMNCLISISGIITYKSANKIREALQYIPLDRILVETDAPFLTPHLHRKINKFNEPSFICETIDAIAEIKGLSKQEISNVTTDNFYKLFQLKKFI